MKRKRMYKKGFTLLELLVSLMLFALVGLGAHTLFHTILKAHEEEKRHAAQLAQLQKALWIIAQDMEQMNARSLQMNPGNYTVSFVRGGWDNTLDLPRSDMLKVVYGIEGSLLKRYYWPYERQDLPPQSQVLLTGIESFDIQKPFPQLAQVTLTVQPFGTIQRLVEIPQP